DGIAVRNALADFHVSGTSTADPYRTRLEPAFTSINDDELAVPAVNYSVVWHTQNRLSASCVDLGFCIHVGPQNKIRIRKLDPHPYRAGGRGEVRIDQRDLSWKPLVVDSCARVPRLADFQPRPRAVLPGHQPTPTRRNDRRFGTAHP